MYAYALNRIQRPDPKDESKTEIISARTVFEINTEKFNELAALNAVRKATGDEIDIHKAKLARLKGQSVPAVSSSTTKASEGNTPADDLVGKTVVELKAIAEDETIDLGDLTKKDDILDKIRAERATRVAGDGNNLLG